MYADAGALCDEVLIDLYTPRERLFVDQWCDKHRQLPAKGTSSAVTGQWDTARVPYFYGVFRAHTNPEMREGAIQKSTQIGATECFIGISLFDSAHSKTQMIVYPDNDSGDDLSTRRMEPAIRACPKVERRLRSIRPIVVDEVRFRDGALTFFSSAESLRSNPVGNILADEIDAWRNTKEDGLTNCRSRMRTFDDGTLWKASTSLGNETGIIKEYDDADVQHTYQLPCPECGQFFELFDFEMLDWHGGLDTAPEIARRNCGVKCPHCKAKIREENKKWMVQHGLWLTQHETVESDGSITATLNTDTRRLKDGCRMIAPLTADFFRTESEQPDPLLRDQGMDPAEAQELRDDLGIEIIGPRSHGARWGFRLNTLVSLIAAGGWSELVYEFVQAKGKLKLTWWRDNFGYSPTKAIKQIDAHKLSLLCDPRSNGGHDHGQCPSWAAGCFGGIDIQKTCIKAAVWAFSPMMRRSALVLTKRIDRDESLKLSEPGIISWLKDIMLESGLPVQTPSPHAVDGFERRRVFPMMFMDTGYCASDAYKLIRVLQKTGAPILACKGESNDQKAIKPFFVRDVQHHKNLRGEPVSDIDPTQLVMVNGPYLKEMLADRLRPEKESIIKGIVDHHGEEFDRDHPAELPGIDTWLDDDGLSMYEEVLKELTAEHLTMFGKGSGKPGDKGKGKLRQVWDLISAYRKNDYWDCSVYAWCAALFAMMDQYTDEEFAQQLAMIEAQLQGQVTTPQRRKIGTAGLD